MNNEFYKFYDSLYGKNYTDQIYMSFSCKYSNRMLNFFVFVKGSY